MKFACFDCNGLFDIDEGIIIQWDNKAYPENGTHQEILCIDCHKKREINHKHFKNNKGAKKEVVYI